MSNRELGVWILPQPRSKQKYIKIPRMYYHRFTPYGYVVDEQDPKWLIPVPLELDALEEAKKHVKKYGYRAVAAWLTTRTDRSITADGLSKRIKYERSHANKAAYYKRIAEEYKKALKNAEKYEKLCDKTDRSGWFEEEFYVALSSEWDAKPRVDDTSGRSARKHHLQAKSGATDSVPSSP